MAMFNLHIQSQKPSFFVRLKPKWTSSSRDLSIVPVELPPNSSLKSALLINDPTVVRRTANFHPSIWDFDFVQSLKSDYTGEMYDRHAKMLKENVRCMLFDEDTEWVAQLELIDSLQRLGLGHLFDKEVMNVLDTISAMINNSEDNLHAVSLSFRLLRQHGYVISQDVFSSFMNKRGTFKESLCEDIKGMLSLYEASYLAFEGENTLEDAKAFTRRHLKNMKKPIDPNLAKQVRHSLNLPLHLRVLRLEARCYIGEYANKDDSIPHLLELAKVDYNMMQAIHQNDLQNVSRWWKNLGFGTKLRFARDRSVESYLWSVGVIPHSQFGTCREGLAKLNSMLTVIDDMYDVYGSLDELKLFTNAVERWEISATEQLPDYMKMCFLGLYNTINEIAYGILKEKGLSVVPYLRKAWAKLCKAFFIEAKWYYDKYTPNLEEYLNTASVTISGPIIVTHAYFLTEKEITKEGLKWLESCPNIIHSASLAFRLYNDLAASTTEIERGDVPKAIECYMHETGVSEELAREHIKNLLSDTWKKMNKDRINLPFSLAFAGIIINSVRMARCMYEHGDGHSVSDTGTKDRIMSLLVDPIPII